MIIVLLRKIPKARNSEKGCLLPIFTVKPKKDGSSRLILNRKKLNRHVKYHHFKKKIIQYAALLVTKYCYMASNDLLDLLFLSCSF